MTDPAALAHLADLHEEMAKAYRAIAQAAAVAPAAGPDEVLRIREACARMQWRYSWARHRWSALGGYKDLDGGLKIRASALARRKIP